MQHRGAVATRSRQGEVQRVGDVLGTHVLGAAASHVARLAGMVQHKGPFEKSLFIAIAALAVSHISLRQMSDLPLVSGKLLIVPTFIATYSVGGEGCVLCETARMH